MSALEIARQLVRMLESEQRQPTYQERLDAIFLAGKANIDAITANAVARLELLAEDYKPKEMPNLDRPKSAYQSYMQRVAAEQQSAYAYQASKMAKSMSSDNHFIGQAAHSQYQPWRLF